MNTQIYTEQVMPFDHIYQNDNNGPTFEDLSVLQTKSSVNGQIPKMANLTNVCMNMSHVINKLKTRLNYKIYSLMLPVLLIFLIVFCILVWKRGDNAIKMSELSDNLTTVSADLNKASDTYNMLYTDENVKNDILTAAFEHLNLKQKELNNIKSKYNSTIHIDNYCDKLADLCNGIIGAILMVYIGSAGYKMIRHNEKHDKALPTCPLQSKSLMSRLKKNFVS